VRIENYAAYKKEIGNRFKAFRLLVGKSQREFSAESELPIEYISQIELGTILPGIISVEYFTRSYGLNISWLVTGKGYIFQTQGTETPRYAYLLDKMMDYRDPEFVECLETLKDTGIFSTKEELNELQKEVTGNYPRYQEFYNQQTKNIRRPEREVNNG